LSSTQPRCVVLHLGLIGLRVGAELLEIVDRQILARDEHEHPGSWWPDWQAWIEGLDGERVPAREIGAGLLKPIEDAPGSYVRVKG
jgi:hypothetical protein